ncbi:secreted RxLR effector protein 161-like [Drosophila rhopaloa]|uniref:Retrovirus-related Pol polyprotein from transposon TNT 1-94 n=1 Tax=Drosophila rhopaloa TaxID=1041015 RepID=A0ABM5JCZ7_DRORH|nr:secreted RxLR effector protein 161-like [Drosophila rhopaloa]
MTRPDIAYAVNFLSQFNSSYDANHWKAAKRVLRYLRRSETWDYFFKAQAKICMALSTQTERANLTDRRSYSGQAFILAGAAVSWEARKQRTVALSSTESEYLAMSSAAKEAVYLKALLNSLGWTCETVKIFNDNQIAQSLVKGFGFHPRRKQIDVRHHFIQDMYKSGDIDIEYMQTDKMPADVMTKGLNSFKHSNCISWLGITCIN